RLRKREEHLVGRDRYVLGQSGNKISPPYVHGNGHGSLISRTDVYFKLFGSPLSYEDIMLLSYESDYGIVKVVAGNLYGFAYDGSSEGKHGYIRRSSAYVDDHASAWSGNIYSGSYGGGHRFLYKHYVPCSGVAHGVLHRPLFNLRYSAWNTYGNRRLYKGSFDK